MDFGFSLLGGLGKFVFFHFWYIILVPMLTIILRKRVGKKLNFLLLGLLICYAIDSALPLLAWHFVNPDIPANQVKVQLANIGLGVIVLLLLSKLYAVKGLPNEIGRVGEESRFPYVIAGLSYIPLIGVIFGIIAAVWGITTAQKGAKKVALIGIGGIAFTLLIYGGLFYFGFVKRGGVYDNLRHDMAKTMLTSLVQTVEFYKLQHENYPATLKDLEKSLDKNQLVSVYDPTQMRIGEKPSYFYYQLSADGSTYYLFGVGADGKPFTADDILPDVSISQNVGLRFPSGKRQEREKGSLREKYGDREYKDMSAKDLHALGLRLFNRKEYEEAARIWLFEADKDKNNANTWNNIGIAFKYAGEYEKALRYSVKAIELNPKFGHGYMSVGRVFLETGRYSDAEKYLLKALDNNWRDADTYFNLGLACQNLHKGDEAKKYFQKVKEMSPRYPTIDQYLR
jgi:tetratricopeptide (TPR) repeat protein